MTMEAGFLHHFAPPQTSKEALAPNYPDFLRYSSFVSLSSSCMNAFSYSSASLPGYRALTAASLT